MLVQIRVVLELHPLIIQNHTLILDCSVYKSEAYNYTKHEASIIGEPASIKNDLNCEHIEPLVIGGNETKPKQLPHMVNTNFIRRLYLNFVLVI